MVYSQATSGQQAMTGKRRYQGPAEAIEEEEELVGSDDENPFESDGEDPFETDTRPVNKGKRAAISSTLPASKRPRISSAQQGARYAKSAAAAIQASSQRSPIVKQPPSSSMPQRAAPSASSYKDMPPPSSVPNFTALKEEKRLILQQARLNQKSPPFKQRHVWSDKDSLLLLRLVRDRQAAWSTIEGKDNHLFEHPRNQQAYRDKARNMKVDYLMTDAILPPCFDLVALGKKEIARLQALGKNPYRRESEIDVVTRRAINTEFRGPLSDV